MCIFHSGVSQSDRDGGAHGTQKTLAIEKNYLQLFKLKMSAVKVMCHVLKARQSCPVNRSVLHESVGTSQSSLSVVTSCGTTAF